jgi:hypothetical protein
MVFVDANLLPFGCSTEQRVQKFNVIRDQQRIDILMLCKRRMSNNFEAP